jgi:hypothetical protein
VFFSNSPGKWAILTEEVSLSLQSQSDTHWSSIVAAIHPTVKHLPGILKSLDHVLTEMNLKVSEKICGKATSLESYFSSFERTAIAGFWFEVLSSINK